MGYYHIQISNNVSNLCTIIIQWENYCYKHLPMRVANSPDIFQQKMIYLFHGFEFISAYINEILILTKENWTDHVQKLYLTPNKMKEKYLNVILKIFSLENPKWNI